MMFLCDYLKNEWEEIFDNDICLMVIGDLDWLLGFVCELLDVLMVELEGN